MYTTEAKRSRYIYIYLFTCATSKAVHLEVIADLLTEIFFLAFCHFAGRRSTPRLMISDNATTFQAAAEELKLGLVFVTGSKNSA